LTTAVLIIDMQNAFFESPQLRGQQERVVRECNAVIAAAVRSGHRVLVVCTEHERDKSTWTLSMLEDDQGFIFRGSNQAEVVPGLEAADLPRLVKTRDSAFVGTDLLLRLRNWDVDRLILAGVATQNCVAQTAADAFANNFHVAFARNALASDNQEFADAMLGVLSDEYRQPVLDREEILSLFSAGRENAPEGDAKPA
jgi:nicotinamidase-related amidase